VKRQIPGVLAALLLCWMFPARESLSVAWKGAWSAGTATLAAGSPLDEKIILRPARDTSDSASDNASVSDPFRTEAPPFVQAAGPRSDLGVPPPPRPWRVTGRVGERAAVLAHPDGRVLVVSTGGLVDSSRVVSIGAQGIVLEDRAGQYTLKIP
jgi:hypothetical protein